MSDLFGSGAAIDGEYRYSLRRVWAPDQGTMLFVMLNPSTADADTDDPTIRRCMAFARREGYGALEVVNLYGFRATNPDVLDELADPVGPANDQAIQTAAAKADTVVAAWGAKAAGYREIEVLGLLRRRNVYCLGRTRYGHPRHPLYVHGAHELELFAPGETS